MVKQYFLVSLKILCDVLSFAIIARILLSWVNVDRSHPLYVFLHEVTSPILNLASRITPKMGILDLSPLIALVSLDIVKYLLLSLFGG